MRPSKLIYCSRLPLYLSEDAYLKVYINNQKLIPFSPPRIDQKTLEEVNKVLVSGWITTGPRTKEFEKRITIYCEGKKTLCLNSATAAMEMVLRWFGVNEGDEVIIPSYTYCATANVVVHLGATPVMVDVNPEDFNIDVGAVRAAITVNTKVIVPVDIAGWPCDYNAINEVVKQKAVQDLFNPSSPEQKRLGRILVMSDAAHSFGATYRGKRTGSLTDASVFSFHAVKNLTTAEGGAVVFNLPECFDSDVIYRALNVRSLHGQTKDALHKTDIGSWRYDVIEAGFKCNMTDIAAAIGLVELERYDENMARRREIFHHYNEAFGCENWAMLPPYQSKGKETSYHLYLLRIRNASECQRDKIIEEIFRQNVSVNVHFQPLPILSFYKNLGYRIDEYPNALSSYERVISLPVYFDLSNDQVARVINAVKTSVAKFI